MSIITVAEINSILGISGKDDQLQTLIPLAESKAISYTQNPFHIPDQYVEEYGISFSASTKKIINTAGNFIIESYGNIIRFQAGLYCHVEHSILNDGFYKIASAAAGELTVSSNDELFDEAAGALIRISLVKFSKGFKLDLAKYIGHLLNAPNADKQAESIGDYSYSNKSEKEILSEFFRGYIKIGVV